MKDNLELALRTGQEVSPGIKTCVRFCDNDESVTARVREAEQLEKKYGATLDALGRPRNGRLMRWWYRRQLRNIGDSKRRAKETAIEHSISALLRAIKAKEKIAVEKNDHSYRFLNDNESLELAERVSAAKSGWIFVFKPNKDLLADRNTIVTRIM
ncbi:MAG TPA: hypothetical protein VHD55_02000 [Candidatus Paceibacterota bacterium]|nr:hypothetical protein [Candidatus Paceibacterota bacterium]